MNDCDWDVSLHPTIFNQKLLVAGTSKAELWPRALQHHQFFVCGFKPWRGQQMRSLHQSWVDIHLDPHWITVSFMLWVTNHKKVLGLSISWIDIHPHWITVPSSFVNKTWTPKFFIIRRSLNPNVCWIILHYHYIDTVNDDEPGSWHPRSPKIADYCIWTYSLKYGYKNRSRPILKSLPFTLAVRSFGSRSWWWIAPAQANLWPFCRAGVVASKNVDVTFPLSTKNAKWSCVRCILGYAPVVRIQSLQEKTASNYATFGWLTETKFLRIGDGTL